MSERMSKTFFGPTSLIFFGKIRGEAPLLDPPLKSKDQDLQKAAHRLVLWQDMYVTLLTCPCMCKDSKAL